MMNQALSKAISYGITAPNPHNTQAWKVKILDPTSFLLYVDEKRLVTASDPPARQIHLGKGTFIERVTVGMTGEGYDTLVDYFPKGEYSIGECGKKPVAHITLQKNEGIVRDPLFDAIPIRVTNRKPYTGTLISEAEWNDLKRFIGTTHSSVFTTGTEDAVKEYIRITQEAVRIDLGYPAAYEETWQWLRKNDQEVADHKDGLSLRGQGFFSGLFGGMMMKFAQASISTHEKYLSEKTKAQTINLFIKNFATSRGFIYLKTSANTQLDWVLSGRDYARVNLAAARLNLAIHPVNQVLQEYPEMDSLRHQFEVLTGQQGTEKIQMLARVGRARTDYHSPRRNVEDILMPNA